jgi:hypothetical protein
MEYNERNVTVVEVFKKLEEVEKQNKEILEKLENMQESNALFHNGFATIFEVLRCLNEVKQNEDCEEILKSGLIANIISIVSLKKKHMKTTIQSKQEKEGKAKDVIEFLKMLKNI